MISVTAVACALGISTVPAADAAPSNSIPPSTRSTAATLGAVTAITPRHLRITVNSPAMRGPVQVSILLPRDTSRPRASLYLLDGAGAGKGESDWVSKGHAVDFFDDKNVTVVMPAGGAGTYYTNWRKRDRVLGAPQWETFLTAELPALIDNHYGGNGINAIGGISMGGQAAFILASRHPTLYTAVGSLSGCPPTTGPVNEAFVRGTVAKEGADATNMWGPPGAAAWSDHDPATRLNALRDKYLYISAGQGTPGPRDQTAPIDSPLGRSGQILAGSALEGAAYRCSAEFAASLRKHNVGVTVDFPVVGTHNWPYWAARLPGMWQTLSRGL
ncbi:esterase family protein [Williamsia sp. CHRR-6]|nr:esterase family protein [Williamsia sp. CHRR-6]